MADSSNTSLDARIDAAAEIIYRSTDCSKAWCDRMATDAKGTGGTR